MVLVPAHMHEHHRDAVAVQTMLRVDTEDGTTDGVGVEVDAITRTESKTSTVERDPVVAWVPTPQHKWTSAVEFARLRHVADAAVLGQPTATGVRRSVQRIGRRRHRRERQ
uniref:Putative ribosomal RNA small subunit methyltransferase A n=1 Tax=Lygus hesperus TaxID=30085 RepID=A0A0A9XUE2_LYGHE